MFQPRDAEFDILFDCVHVSVEHLPVASFVFEGGAGQFFVVLAAFEILWEVVLAGWTGAGEPVRLLQKLSAVLRSHVAVVRTVVVVDLLPLRDAPAGHRYRCPAPKHDHKVWVTAARET